MFLLKNCQNQVIHNLFKENRRNSKSEVINFRINFKNRNPDPNKKSRWHCLFACLNIILTSENKINGFFSYFENIGSYWEYFKNIGISYILQILFMSNPIFSLPRKVKLEENVRIPCLGWYILLFLPWPLAIADWLKLSNCSTPYYIYFNIISVSSG